MKRLFATILTLTMLFTLPICAPAEAKASNLTISKATVSNIKLPEPGTTVADYVGTTECPAGKNYSVLNKQCYWSNESKTEMYGTNVFGSGTVYYYSIVLKTSGSYVFDSAVKLSISDGVVDPGMQVILRNGGAEVEFRNAYKITCGVGQVRTIDHIKLSKETFYYNGKTQTPKVTVYDDTGAKISKGYKVSYSGDRKKVGVVNVTVEPKDSTCVGKATAQYTINPSTPKSVKAKGAKKSVKVSWKKPSSGKPDAYDVFVYSDKACKKVVTSATVTGTSKTIGGLKSKKTYYVKVDCYVQKDETLVSKPSKAVKVKMK